MGEGEAVRDGVPQSRQDVGPDVRIGVLVDGNSGRRVGDEDEAKAVLDPGRCDDLLDFRGQIDNLFPGPGSDIERFHEDLKKSLKIVILGLDKPQNRV
jgi:hypothetical protein